MTSCFLLGDSLLLVSTRARFLTSMVMCFKWSLKSSMGLICTPSILYDLFGGRYLVFEVPSSNLIVFIWFINRFMFALLIGLPYPHKTPVASHFEVYRYSHVYLLKRYSSLFGLVGFLGSLWLCLCRLHIHGHRMSCRYMWAFGVDVWVCILYSLWRAIGGVVPWISWIERERVCPLVVCLYGWVWWGYCHEVSCSRYRILCKVVHMCWCSIPGILGLSWFWRVLYGPYHRRRLCSRSVPRIVFFFDILASSYIMIYVERLSYIFLCRLNPSAVSLRMPCASAHGEPMFVRMEVHSLNMPFISAIGL
jgi:hypothetical protein